MTTTNLGGNPVTLKGDFPQKGDSAKPVAWVNQDLSQGSLDDFNGQRKVLNIFPSIDTGICATSVRTFNLRAAELTNTKVICLSFDLPFAQQRFCGAEGIENVVTGSLFRNSEVARDYGVLMQDGPLAGLSARAVIVLDENNTVIHAQLVDDIKKEPDYDAALAVL